MGHNWDIVVDFTSFLNYNSGMDKSTQNEEKSKSKPDDLTYRQELFCQEYVSDPDLNATKAAIRAGYSKISAAVIACENLNKPNIKVRIEQLMSRRLKRLQTTQDDIFNELKRIAFSDMRKVAAWNGSTVVLKNSEELEEDDAACVESVSQVETKDGGSLSIKLHSKTKALELLARHAGMLNDKLNVGGQKDNPVNISNIWNMVNPDTKEKLIELESNANEIALS